MEYTEDEIKYFKYLNKARDRGRYNMFEAPIHLNKIFGINLNEGKRIFRLWRDDFEELQKLGF